VSIASPRDPFALAADYWAPAPDGEEDADRALARRCAEHLPTLIREAWPVLEPARRFVPSWHIDCVAEHLMAVSAGEILRLVINQPPRTTKSITTAVCWPAWEWILHPHVRWLFASYAQDFAQRDSLKMRRLVRSAGGRSEGTLFERVGYQGVLRLLGQTWRLEKDQDAKNLYETTATGMRMATSVGGVATGEGGDRVVVDDPINAKQARSPALRAATNRWWDETMTTRFNDARGAAVIVMQRLHEQDLTGHLLARDAGWHHLCLPAEYIPAHQFTYPAAAVLPSGRTIGGDPRVTRGELLDPVRLDPGTLEQRRVDLGSYAYAGQFQQQPAPEEGGMFKRAWWVRRWHPGFDRYLHLGWDRLVQSWDMRFGDSKKASSSYVVGQVWGFHGADCYLLAQARGRFSFTQTVAVVRALTAFEPRATYKLVEDKANGPAVIDALKREITGFIAIEPEGGKDVRASAVSPRAERGEVILPAADTIPCPEFYIEDIRGPDGTVIERKRHELEPTTVADWIQEHATFPAGAYDDQVDAHTQAITWANPQPRVPHESKPPEPPPPTIMGGILDEPL
jgi:predicted phage terminase large subunit-like protein